MDFLNALKFHSDIIPRKEYPFSIFFLLNCDNFRYALKTWLGYGLQESGFDVIFFFFIEDI